MPRRVRAWLLSLLACGFAREAHAQVLIAGSAAARSELMVAQVFGGAESSAWLSLRVEAAGRFALVTADGAASSQSADAWLRALDFASRMRVAPPDELALSCPGVTPELADSGLPEPVVLDASSSELVGSELELRRALEGAGIVAGVDELSAFSAALPAPYRISWFSAEAASGATQALSVALPDARALVRVWATGGADEVSLALLALGARPLSPVEPLSLPRALLAEPATLEVSYTAETSRSNYRAARAAWREASPHAWLFEASEQNPWFEAIELPGWGALTPAVPRYLRAAAGEAEACVSRVSAAAQAGSRVTSSYACAPELARALTLLGSGAPVLSRYFGTLAGGSVVDFVDATLSPRAPLLAATSLDALGCGAPPPNMPPPPPAGPPPSSAPGAPPPPAPGTDTGGDVYVGTDSGYLASSDGCSASFGDDSQSSSSRDSCSGDSSSSAGDDDSGASDSSDSCSGDSSSSSSDDDGATHDSCSSDSSGTNASSDGSGCGQSSGSHDDTCSGSSARSSGSDSQELALSGHAKRKPRARVSLLSMTACCFILPWRRRRRKTGSERARRRA